MGVVEALTSRNADFSANQFSSGLRLMPSLKTIVIGCVDPRVDPNAVLGVAPGEVGTIRNVGGRVTPGLLREMVMLRKVVQAGGGDIGPGWEFVVLHHTDCGITRLEAQPEMLSEFFEVDQDQLRRHDSGLARTCRQARAGAIVDPQRPQLRSGDHGLGVAAVTSARSHPAGTTWKLTRDGADRG